MAPKLILHPPKRPGETRSAQTPEQKPPNTSMFNEDGSMRMMAGWTKIERHNEMIGRRMPFARKETKVAPHDGDAYRLWSHKGKDSKQIMLLVNELSSPSEPESLPLLTKDSIREITRSDGTIDCRIDFKPFSIYNFDAGNDPRTARQDTDGQEQNQKREYAVEIFYPLFSVENIERTEKREIKRSSSVSSRRGDDWDYGPWSLNNEQAGLWEAAHPGVRLVRFEDGRWSHPDFFEKEYVTTMGTRRTESSISSRRDLGLFSVEGELCVWKLAPHCQNIQLYEAHMDKKIRRHFQRRQEEKAKFEQEGSGNAAGESI